MVELGSPPVIYFTRQNISMIIACVVNVGTVWIFFMPHKFNAELFMRPWYITKDRLKQTNDTQTLVFNELRSIHMILICLTTFACW